MDEGVTVDSVEIEPEAMTGRSWTARRWWTTVLLVLMLATAVRGLYLVDQERHNPLFGSPKMDGAYHHQWAAAVARGEGLGDRPFFRAPLYYLALGALYRATGPDPVAGRVAGAVLGILSCGLIAGLGRAVFGPRAGVLAGALAAGYWPLVYFDGELLTVGLEIFLGLAMLRLLIAAGNRGASWLDVATGLLWGLSAITRPTVLTLAPVIALWLWLRTRPPRRLAATVLRLGLVGVGAAVAILPVTLHNLLVGGERVLIASNGGVNFFIGNNPQSDGVTAVVPGTRKDWAGGYEDTHRIAEAAAGRPLSEREVSDYWYGRAVDWISSSPAAAARHQLYKLRRFWSATETGNNQAIWPFARLSWIVRLLGWLSFPVVASLAAGGLVLARDRWLVALPLLGFLLLSMLTTVAFFCNARYRLPVVPVLLLLAAAGVDRAWRLIAARDLRPLAAALVAAGVAGLFVATNPPDPTVARRNDELNAALLLGVHAQTPPPEGPGDADAAARWFARAVELGPGLPEARAGLARALAGLGRFDEARPHAEAAARLQPESPENHLLLGSVLARRGNLAEAADEYRRSLQLRPDWAPAHQELGCLLAFVGRADEAIPHLETALRLAPGTPRATQCLDQARRSANDRQTPSP